MKRISFILLLCAIVSVASAQKITHIFQDVLLSEALKYIQEQATDYNMPSCRLLASIQSVWSRVENMRFMWNVPTRLIAI